MKLKNKKIYILIILFVLVLFVTCIFINKKTTNNLDIVINNYTHREENIREVVNLITNDFKTKNFKANIISIEYDENNSNGIETTLKNEYDASEALEFNVTFKTWLFTNQELNSNEVYVYRFDYIKKYEKWVLVNYGQG